MGSTTGCWINEDKSNDFPYSIASKLAINHKSITQEQASILVTALNRYYEKYKKAEARITELERDLRIAENTVRLLQIEEDNVLETGK